MAGGLTVAVVYLLLIRALTGVRNGGALLAGLLSQELIELEDRDTRRRRRQSLSADLEGGTEGAASPRHQATDPSRSRRGGTGWVHRGAGRRLTTEDGPQDLLPARAAAGANARGSRRARCAGAGERGRGDS